MSKRKCASCGTEMEHEEGYWHENYKRDICSHCYSKETDTCQLCGNEDLMPSDVSCMILVKHELARTADKPPGIFMILRRPFLSIPLIGGGSMGSSDVLFVDKLPEWDRHYDISGHICVACAKPYQKKCREAYKLSPKSLKEWRYTKQLWWLEKAHTREVILRNRDMLRDLENDKDDGCYCMPCDWEDLKKQYDLPDDLPTFHEYLAFEHRGVKVYGEDITGWIALAPDPNTDTATTKRVVSYSARRAFLRSTLLSGTVVSTRPITASTRNTKRRC